MSDDKKNFWQSFNPLNLVGSLVDSVSNYFVNKSNQSFQQELNEDNRIWNAQQAQLDRNFQAQQAELAFERQEEFYNKYQSPSAMMAQYRDAGLNPALMAGQSAGGVSSTPSSSSPSGSLANSASSSIPSFSPLSMFEGAVNLASMVESIEMMKTEREGKEIDNANKSEGYELDFALKRAQRIKELSSADLDRSKIDEVYSNIRKDNKTIDYLQKQIEIGDSVIALNGSEKELNETRKVVANLDATKQSLLMPYVQARAEAEIAYTKAKTEESINNAERLMYEANLSMLEVMIEQKLIDSTYYDSLVESSAWQAKSDKRSYKWSPINDVCSNLSKIMIATSSMVSSTTSLMGSSSSDASLLDYTFTSFGF